MKKFLTVLLALSVVFTYSFSAVGSVFAATPDEVAAERAKMESAVDAYVGSIGVNTSGHITSLPASGTVDPNVTKAAVDAVAVIVKDKYNAAITQADTAGSTLSEAWAAIDTTAELETEFFTTQAAALYEKVIADVVAPFETKVNGYKVEDYPTVDQETLQQKIDAAVAAIDAAKGASTKDASDTLHTAITTFDEAVKNLKTKAQREADLNAEKADAAKKVDALVAAFKPAATTHYNDVIDNATAPSDLTSAKAQLSTLNTNVNALVEMYKSQIEEVKYDDTKAYEGVADANKKAVEDILSKANAALDTTATGYDYDDYEDAVDGLSDMKVLVQYAQVIAEQKKQEYDPATGLAVYNAATVEKTLKEVVAKIYKKEITSLTGITDPGNEDSTAPFDTMAKAKDEADALANAKKAAVEAVTTGDYNLDKWEGKNADKVKAIQDEYVAKIEAAATADDITKLTAEAKGKMDKIADKTELTRAQIMTELASATLGYIGDASGSFATETLGSLETYANTVAAKNSAAQDKAKKAAVDAAIDYLVDQAIDQYDATTAAEGKSAAIQKILKAGYADALRIIDGMKTDADIKNAATALKDAIAALPTTVTVDEKAKYLDVQKMLEEYDANKYPRADVTNLNLFTAYMTKLVKLEKDAAQALISNLPKNATLADKAAVDAAKAAADAYKEAYSAYKAGSDYAYNYDDLDVAKLTAAVTAVEKAMLVDAAKKIAALPVAITVDDKAAVEAARAAYDALTDAQKETFSSALYEKLVAAEKQLAKVDTEYQKLAIQGTHVKINSSAAKGYIKISWKASNSDVTLDGVEVYRSTKKTSGFKKISTFKKQTSKKYTTNLKKGTKYYYYVKGYKMVGDEKVYTHQSITVGRTFRK